MARMVVMGICYIFSRWFAEAVASLLFASKASFKPFVSKNSHVCCQVWKSPYAAYNLYLLSVFRDPEERDVDGVPKMRHLFGLHTVGGSKALTK